MSAQAVIGLDRGLNRQGSAEQIGCIGNDRWASNRRKGEIGRLPRCTIEQPRQDGFTVMTP